jgi:micrococcal nuclease
MRIKTSKDDKYGRMLADIYGKNDICLNDLLVTSGYAWAYFGDKKVKDFSILSEKRKLYEATTLH